MIIVVAVLPSNEEGRAALPLFQEVVEMAGGHIVCGDPRAPGKGERIRRQNDRAGASFAEKELGRAILERARLQKGLDNQGAKEVAERLGYAPSSGSSYLCFLVKEGALIRKGRGHYEPA